ncbi:MULTISPECIES: arsenate reductase (glutaredoxin) [Hydrogenophaga]|jgi:arsenate reductase|uniref:Arsenate reductase n=1 Tax=Hydrogenophaga pseudoflava TaxID=47421 RepID=A0A4P6X2Y1_HYDPS|nr:MULTISPECIES: arsenate reductase (glutaredoxin) [Hydrogenophaga]QBM28024.1 Arsenate reductase [Hydrogenophaga pseudoflava]
MKPSSITIFHNPQCSTSRNVLAAIRETGVEPEVIDYLKQPYTREQLTALLKAMGMSAGELLRRKGDLYAGLAEANPERSDAEWLDLMVQHPVLVERPIVVTPRGTVLCRPKERLQEVL